MSNTSPVTNLAAIGQLDLLKHLFGRVLIPEAVARELSAAPADTPAAPDLPNLEWIQISPVADRAWVRSLLEELHPGEAEAIVLACEKKAYLLIDENRGRRKADSLGLRHLGVLGVLIRAKRKGLIALVRPLLDALITQAGFWVSRRLYARILSEVGETVQE